jgi:hypothetical protein
MNIFIVVCALTFFIVSNHYHFLFILFSPKNEIETDKLIKENDIDSVGTLKTMLHYCTSLDDNNNQQACWGLINNKRTSFSAGIYSCAGSLGRPADWSMKANSLIPCHYWRLWSKNSDPAGMAADPWALPQP